jgi:hypothetical protein
MAVIKWATGFEINSDFFEIQRIHEMKFNTDKWEVLGKIKSNGNTQQLSKYEFIDNEFSQKLTDAFHLIYRLRQVDIDGASDYSTAVKLRFNEQTSIAIFSLYPNPNNGVFNLSFEGIEGFKTINISNVMVKTIQKF